jgi:hypothetical protein
LGYLAPVVLYSVKNLMRSLKHGTLFALPDAASTRA